MPPNATSDDGDSNVTHLHTTQRLSCKIKRVSVQGLPASGASLKLLHQGLAWPCPAPCPAARDGACHCAGALPVLRPGDPAGLCLGTALLLVGL